MESLEQLSADLPEQQEDFPSLLSAVADFEEQHAAVDLPQASFPPLSAVLEQEAAPSLPFLVVLLFAETVLPPRATLLAEDPPSLVCATSDVVVFVVELASD